MVLPQTIIVTGISTQTGNTFPLSKNTMDVQIIHPDVFDPAEAPRKRRRLTHLTQEERMMRRKLKNRVAAQTARDRKKAKMETLEEQMDRIQEENKRLLQENQYLLNQTTSLTHENTELRHKLGLKPDGEAAKKETGSPVESAAGTDPCSLSADHLLHGIPDNNESDDLIGLLEQITAENNASDEPSTPPGPCVQQHASTDVSTSAMVGPTTAELESLNELIKFDHVYYKVTSPAGLAVTSPSQQMTARGAIMSAAQQPTISSPRPIKPIKQGEKNAFLGKVQVDASNVPTLHIPEISFDRSLSQESLDRLLDLDFILQEDLKQNVELSTAPMVASTSSQAATNTNAEVSCNAVLKESPAISTTTGLCSHKRKLSNQGLASVLNTKYSLSPRNQRLESDDIVRFDELSPFADSSYSSDLSDAASPRSDVSSPLEEDGWEESFTELFPSLV